MVPMVGERQSTASSWVLQAHFAGGPPASVLGVPLRTLRARDPRPGADPIRSAALPARFLEPLAARRGQLMPALVQRQMQALFGGVDLQAVRIHAAPETARLGAQAFTCGDNIYFAPGQYQPDAPAGRKLLAHELTHVLQQRAGRVAAHGIAGPILVASPALEAEAEAMAARAESGAGGVVQRQQFKVDGYPISSINFFSNFYDTANVDQFKGWVGDLLANANVQVLDRLRQNLAARAGSPVRHERIAASRVQLALDLLAPRARGSALDRLPRSRWWLLFIEGEQHRNGPLVFDTDQSPGFYATMARAFERTLLPARGRKLDFAAYDAMHYDVTLGVMRPLSRAEQTFEAVPHTRSGGWRGNTQFVHPATLRADPAAWVEMYNDGDITLNARAIQEVAEVDQTAARVLGSGDKPQAAALCTFTGVQYKILTTYDSGDVPRLVNRLFSRFYDAVAVLKRQQVQSPDDILDEIVRLVRALHVGHFYVDANGRLNTMLLLNRLLVDHDFSPVILRDTSIFGGAQRLRALRETVKDGFAEFERAVRDDRAAAPAGRLAPTQATVSLANRVRPHFTVANLVRAGGALGAAVRPHITVANATGAGVFAAAALTYYYWN